MGIRVLGYCSLNSDSGIRGKNGARVTFLYYILIKVGYGPGWIGYRFIRLGLGMG